MSDRYLTPEDLDKLGYTPKLVHKGMVYSFIEPVNNNVIGYGSVAYQAATLLLLMDDERLQPLDFSIRDLRL